MVIGFYYDRKRAISLILFLLTSVSEILALIIILVIITAIVDYFDKSVGNFKARYLKTCFLLHSRAQILFVKVVWGVEDPSLHCGNFLVSQTHSRAQGVRSLRVYLGYYKGSWFSRWQFFTFFYLVFYPLNFDEPYVVIQAQFGSKLTDFILVHSLIHVLFYIFCIIIYV